jgi:prepilin-type N-terminal cleavage/methylation domain-containing protein
MQAQQETPAVKRKAFTLVELLVVIGIIALLVAILLPALNKAREQARLVKCMSGARQVYFAIEMYCNEQHGYYPFGSGFNAVTPQFWHAQLVELKYLNEWTQTNRGGCPHGPDKFDPSSGALGDYYTSPATPAVSYGMNPYIQSGWNFHSIDGYAMHGHLKRTDGYLRRHSTQVGLVWCSHVPWTYASQDTVLYVPPQQCLGIADGYLYGSLSQPQPPPYPYRHFGKGLPVACVDGHVDVAQRVEFTVYPPQSALGSGIFYYSIWGVVFGVE